MNASIGSPRNRAAAERKSRLCDSTRRNTPSYSYVLTTVPLRRGYDGRVAQRIAVNIAKQGDFCSGYNINWNRCGARCLPQCSGRGQVANLLRPSQAPAVSKQLPERPKPLASSLWFSFRWDTITKSPATSKRASVAERVGSAPALWQLERRYDIFPRRNRICRAHQMHQVRTECLLDTPLTTPTRPARGAQNVRVPRLRGAN